MVGNWPESPPEAARDRRPDSVCARSFSAAGSSSHELELAAGAATGAADSSLPLISGYVKRSLCRGATDDCSHDIEGVEGVAGSAAAGAAAAGAAGRTGDSRGETTEPDCVSVDVREMRSEIDVLRLSTVSEIRLMAVEKRTTRRIVPGLRPAPKRGRALHDGSLRLPISAPDASWPPSACGSLPLKIVPIPEDIPDWVRDISL